jgi:ParB family chromosome partitioning protein
MKNAAVTDEYVNTIIVGAERRPVDPAAVDRLADSMSRIGLLSPICVRKGISPYGTFLIYGAHRLAAAKQLGWLKIPAVVREDLPGDPIEDELEEIAENLHRADLTVLERSTQTARWIEITDKLSQAAKELPRGRGQPEGGINKAAREIGVDKDAAYRAVKIASLSDAAKDAAVEVGLDDKQDVLLKAAKAPDDVAFLRQEHARREADKQRKEAEKLNKDTSRVIALTDAEQFGQWLMERTDLQELPMIISWLEGTKAKDVINAMRRLAA